MRQTSVDRFLTERLAELNAQLARKMVGDVVLIRCPIETPLDNEFRFVVEGLKRGRDNGRLVAVLNTDEGFVETAERIAAVMRAHYDRVSFVIPNHAYSAGTVLVMSGDDIHMDYYSVLGLIDSQVMDSTGERRSGREYLESYKEISNKINQSSDAESCLAESAFLAARFDPEILFIAEKDIERGIFLVSEWLPKYKFRNWLQTETRGAKVTSGMKKERAEEIAETLGGTSKRNFLGRDISMRRLRSPEINLLIEDFGEDSDLSETIRDYHDLAVDYFSSAFDGFIHSELGLRRVPVARRNRRNRENPRELDKGKFIDKEESGDLVRVLDGLPRTPRTHAKIPFPYGSLGPRPGGWGDKKKASGK